MPGMLKHECTLVGVGSEDGKSESELSWCTIITIYTQQDYHNRFTTMLAEGRGTSDAIVAGITLTISKAYHPKVTETAWTDSADGCGHIGQDAERAGRTLRGRVAQ